MFQFGIPETDNQLLALLPVCTTHPELASIFVVLSLFFLYFYFASMSIVTVAASRFQCVDIIFNFCGVCARYIHGMRIRSGK